MPEGARLVTLGTINSGATPIQADVTVLGSDTPVAVLLSTDYQLSNPRPPGFPFRPSFTGADAADLDFPRIITNGSVVKVLRAEADALIAAGAATLA